MPVLSFTYSATAQAHRRADALAVESASITAVRHRARRGRSDDALMRAAACYRNAGRRRRRRLCASSRIRLER
jgi:hypothetical protein